MAYPASDASNFNTDVSDADLKTVLIVIKIGRWYRNVPNLAETLSGIGHPATP